MFTNLVRQSISAAHKIDNHPGKCSRLHGHNWTIDIVVGSDHLNEIGLAIDFSDIKKISSPLINKLDHSYLNDFSYFKKNPPSSENLARYLYNELKIIFHEKHIDLLKIVVWETETCASTYSKKEKNL